jgi:hypothetical protein
VKTRWLQWVLAVLAVVAIGAVLRNIDWPATAGCLAGIGLRAPLVVVPYFFVLTFDSLGWRSTFENPSRLPIPMLFRLRAATEAVANSAPAGVAMGETLKVILLERRLGIPLTEGAANAVVSKFAMALAQGLFLVGGLGFASATLRANSHRLIGRDGLEIFALGVAALFLALVLLALTHVARGGLLMGGLGILRRVAWPRLARLIVKLEAPFTAVDHGMAAVARVPKSQLVLAVAGFLVGWICLGLENWVILALVGADMSPKEALSMEAAVSIVRILFFFIPSALGAQEASYYGLMRVFGIEHAEVIAASFMILKRAKELFWILCGYSFLSAMQVRRNDIARLSRGAVAQGRPAV